MRTALAPEIFFDLGEIIDVVEPGHRPHLLTRRPSRCSGWFCGTLAHRLGGVARSARGGFSGSGVAFPQNLQAVEGQVFVNLLDVPRAAGDELRLSAGSDDACFAAKFFLNAVENAIHERREAII